MIKALLVARRDLGAYVHGLTGYLIVAAVLFLNGLAFQLLATGHLERLLGGSDARYSHEVLESFFQWTFGFTVVVSLLLTMRSIAEERQAGTDVLLHSSPITDVEIVLGKYLASMIAVAVFLAVTLYMPGLIFVNGKVSLSHIAVGYTGLLFAGSAAVSIGIWASSLFRSSLGQLGAVVISGVLSIVLTIGWALADATDPPFSDILAYSALFERYLGFQVGRLETGAMVYYGSLTFLFLALTTRGLEGRRSA